MSDDRSAVYGIDMVPEAIPDWARVEDSPKPIPATEAERDEHVNADILRRACQVRMTELVGHIRSLPLESNIVVRNIVRLAAQDLETAVERYLAIERKFRTVR